jgi:drug/metabolite transporter (DMT)-like permease
MRHHFVDDRSRRISSFAAVLALAVCGQLAAKAGASRALAGDIVNTLFLASLVCLGSRGVIWALILRRERLVFAYPIMTLVYPVVLVFSVLIFGESLTPGKAVGGALVLIGVAVLAAGESKR